MEIIKVLQVTNTTRNPRIYTATLFLSIPVGLMVSSAIGTYVCAFLNSIDDGFVFEGIVPSTKVIQFKYSNPTKGLLCRCFLDGKNTHFGNRIIVYTYEEVKLKAFIENVQKIDARNEVKENAYRLEE